MNLKAKKSGFVTSGTSENKSNRSREGKTLYENKPLPWWVEVLFVQIGLPDSLLRGFLKKRKRIRQFTSENKKNIGRMDIRNG